MLNEVTPSYLLHPLALKRIHHHVLRDLQICHRLRLPANHQIVPKTQLDRIGDENLEAKQKVRYAVQRQRL